MGLCQLDCKFAEMQAAVLLPAQKYRPTCVLPPAAPVQYLCCEVAQLQLHGLLRPLRVLDVAHMAWRLQAACQLDSCLDQLPGGPEGQAAARSILQQLPPASGWIAEQVRHMGCRLIWPAYGLLAHQRMACAFQMHVTQRRPLFARDWGLTAEPLCGRVHWHLTGWLGGHCSIRPRPCAQF